MTKPSRVLIVDDEPPARFALADLLADRSEVEVVAEAESIKSAVRAIERLDPDIVFLDIELPDGSGFELFEKTALRARVVFLTAFAEYAVRAFEVNALDYLLKPADPERLDRALLRIRKEPSKGWASRLERDDLVCLQEGKKMRFRRVSDIVFIQAADYFSEVHLAEGTVALVPESLRSWKQRLPETFGRVHRSTLVNLDCVDALEQVEDGGWQVRLLRPALTLPVSRRFAQALKARFQGSGP